MEKLTLITRLGTYWPACGDLAYLTNADDEQARIFVDSIGETWVDIRRIPEGGFFHTERVEAYRVFNGWIEERKALKARGFTHERIAPFSHRVHERPI